MLAPYAQQRTCIEKLPQSTLVDALRPGSIRVIQRGMWVTESTLDGSRPAPGIPEYETCAKLLASSRRGSQQHTYEHRTSDGENRYHGDWNTVGRGKPDSPHSHGYNDE
jgi:hypothetical protein